MVHAMAVRLFADKAHEQFHVAHYSLQRDHVHLIVEAQDKGVLSSGIRSVVIAFAKRLAKMVGRRRGKVWADRYHAHVLRTPREARHALAYVLHNAKKHGVADPRASFVDPFSSAPTFDGWSDWARGPPVARRAASPRTWLLGVGWRRGGPLATTDAPKIQRGR